MINFIYSINITFMQQVDIENLKKFGQKVKELREKKSESLNKFVMSQDILTTATWSRIENGKFDFKLSTLLRVAYMLGIKVEDLLKSVDFDYNFIEY